MELGINQRLEPSAAMPLIMVVEDEVLIRLLATDILIDAGFDVVDACTADEALILLSSGVVPDLIFTDVNMPGTIDGLGLVAQVNEAHPHIPVILTSGGVPEHRLAAAQPAATVMKPYTGSVLLGVVNQVLDRRRG